MFYNTTCSASRQGRGSTDAQASALTLDDKIGDGPYQFSFHMKPAAMNVKLTGDYRRQNTKEVLVPPTRIERATRGLGNRCSIQLSYGGVRRM